MSRPDESNRARREQRGRRLGGLPATPLPLEDARLLDYRHPREHPNLMLSLIALLGLVATAILLHRWAILLGVVGIWGSMVIVALQAAVHNTLRGAEVTPTQFPTIYRTLEELRQRFDVPPTRAFVIRQASVKAQTFGFRAPHVIVLPSMLLDALDEEELRYVIGRQMGHIRFGHPWMMILFGGEQLTLPAILSSVASLRDFLFAGYCRATVSSADRAGILACGNVRVAMRTEIKLAVGNNQAPQVRDDDLIAQAHQVAQGKSRLQAMIIRLQSPTPTLVPRLLAMAEWAGLPPRSHAD